MSKIFICYRRVDSQMYAQRLYHELRGRFGDHEIFMDLQRVALGENFVRIIQQQIEACSVLLVVIGPDWLTASDDESRRRLDDERDHVRIEIATALARDGVMVIPLFVNGARPPRPAELPLPLAGLCEMNGQTLRNDDWYDDVAKVEARLVEALGVAPPPPPPRPPGRRPWKRGGAPIPVAGPRDSEQPSDRRGGLLLLAGLATLAVVVLLGVLLLGGGGGATEPPKVRIGALYSLTGVNQEAGNDSLQGLKLAIDYINDDGFPDLGLAMRPGAGLPALDGAKLEPVVQDLGRRRCDAPILFDRLVTGGKVAAVVGAYESTFTLQAIYAANRLKVPLVNDTATAVQLTEDDGADKPTKNACGRKGDDPTPSPWFTRIGASDEQFARLFGNFIMHERRLGKRIRTAAILYESHDIFGESAHSVTRKQARRLGIELTPYPYASQLNLDAPAPGRCPSRRLIAEVEQRVGQIAVSRPDVLFAASYLTDAVVAVQTMAKFDYRPNAMLAYGAGYADSRFVKRAGTANAKCGLPAGNPNGIITRAVGWKPVEGSTAGQASELYEERYGEPMNDTSARSFTAMMALAQAIDEAGSTEPKRVQLALRALSVPPGQTILRETGIEIDANGQNRAAGSVLLQILDGTYRTVYPTELRTAKAVWPLSAAPG